MRINFIIKLFFVFTLFYSSHLYSADCKKPEMPTKDEWLTWINQIKNEGLSTGISKKTLDNELDKVSPQKKIIMRDRCQPESRITFDEYVYYRLDKSKIFAGKKILKKYKNELDLISNHFNIQPRFIVAILGVESFYGKNQGSISTIEAVTTLSFDRRRSNFYKKQLLAALKIIDDGLVPSDLLVGSWGGATGAAQFLPTTYLESAYDFDGDGFADIWKNNLDIWSSVANYLTGLKDIPWDNSSTWGREVMPPKNIKEIYETLKQKNPKGCAAVKNRSISKELSEWDKLGFHTIDGNKLPIKENLKARLVAPDGINGKRFFLVYPNYKNILYYNCSSYYAITIGLLSDEIIN